MDNKLEINSKIRIKGLAFVIIASFFWGLQELLHSIYSIMLI